MICWTLFWWTCTPSSDQVVVQRYFSTGSTQAAGRSFACNVVANVVTTLLLCVCGIALYSYYKAELPAEPDQVFPYFIRHTVPRGLAGLVVAALFSAAMSSLDSGINSLSSVVTTDFYRRLWKKDPDPKHELTIARTITLVTGLFAIVTCLLLELIPEDQRGNLFDITGRVSSFLVGSLGGMMFVAILRIRSPGPLVIAAALVGMTVGLIWAQGQWLFGLQKLAWMWVIPVSILVTFVTAMVLSRFFPASQSGSPTW